MSKYTPGPWNINGDDPTMIISANLTVARVQRGLYVGKETGKANAHLIASAPHLLSASKKAVELLQQAINSVPPHLTDSLSTIADAIDVLRPAIIHAEGISDEETVS